jgi:hypothetical protein
MTRLNEGQFMLTVKCYCAQLLLVVGYVCYFAVLYSLIIWHPERYMLWLGQYSQFSLLYKKMMRPLWANSSWVHDEAAACQFNLTQSDKANLPIQLNCGMNTLWCVYPVSFLLYTSFVASNLFTLSSSAKTFFASWSLELQNKILMLTY